MTEALDQILIKIQRPEDLSTRLLALILISNLNPLKFLRLQLYKYTYADLTALKESCCPSSIWAKIKCQLKGTNLVDLQAKLDLCYISKLLGHKEEFDIPSGSLKDRPLQDINDQLLINHLKTKDPWVATLIYICIRSLLFCQSDEPDKHIYLAHLAQEIPFLAEVARQDDKAYAYLMTHLILYETQFGTLKANSRCHQALGLLSNLYPKLTKEAHNLDLLAEIIIVAKICGPKLFPYYAELLDFLKKSTAADNYHEKAVIAVATF